MSSAIGVPTEIRGSRKLCWSPGTIKKSEARVGCKDGSKDCHEVVPSVQLSRPCMAVLA